ncbi:uncharacterized protein LOC129596131 [Paramacrobiotus metropolitanus]|uniref:uncharacterized protein LOC129596131 n=1 Tax=Paramacrobiotus metropolitanus TaxID=2943436 RepID=UPI002445A0B4|nr:uncharacterized protein LOC129596131 [Paramacrobiotus metropolitanus]
MLPVRPPTGNWSTNWSAQPWPRWTRERRWRRSANRRAAGQLYSFTPPLELVIKMANKVRLNTMVNLPGKGVRPARELVEMLPQHPAYQDKKSMQKRMGLPDVEPLSGVAVLDILTYHAIVACNTETIYNTVSGTAPIGFAVYPVKPQRLMTAVCWDVNVVINFRGRCMVIHATEDIPVYNGMKDLRFSNLRQQFFSTRDERRGNFEKSTGGHPCTCRKCTEKYDAEINMLKCVTAGCSSRIPSDRRAMEACTDCGAVNGERLKEFRRYMQRFASIKASYPAQPKITKAQGMLLCEEMDAAGILQPDAHFRFVCGWELPRKYFLEDRFEDGWKMTQEVVACMRSIYPKYETYGAVLLTLATMHAAEALEKHVVDRVKKLPKPAKKQLEKLSSEAFRVLIEYCQAALHIMTVVYGEESEEAEIANNQLTGVTNQSRKIAAMFRAGK